MRNLMYPLNWDEVFAMSASPAFLKPFDGGGWKRCLPGALPGGVLRCLRRDRHALHDAAAGRGISRNTSAATSIGQEKVHIMRYDPKRPSRAVREGQSPPRPELKQRIEKDALDGCRRRQA